MTPILRAGDVTVGLTTSGLAARVVSGPLRAGLTRRWDGEVEAGLEAAWRF